MSQIDVHLDGEEQDLVDRLRSGDEAAYETLVRDYGGPMLAVTRRLLGNDDDARDALQDAFISAFKAIDRFQGDARLSTWLHRIAVNAALMKLRAQRRRRERPIEELMPRFTSNGHIQHDGARWVSEDDSPAEREETRRLVREKINELPDNYRTVLLLRDIEELDTRQTAEHLNVSESVVKTRLHRARLALRALLSEAFARGEA